MEFPIYLLLALLKCTEFLIVIFGSLVSTGSRKMLNTMARHIEFRKQRNFLLTVDLSAARVLLRSALLLFLQPLIIGAVR